MKLSYILLYIGLPIINAKRLFSSKINNLYTPVCVNCKYYKPEKYNNFDSITNKCTYFGYKNIYNGEINYDYVNLCRSSEDKCGNEAKYFEKEPEPNLLCKKMKHNISYNFIFYFFYLYVSIFLTYVYGNIHK